MKKQFIYETDNVNIRHYTVIGIVYMKNGCCNDQPVLLTANRCTHWKEGINYSCQCGCGGWCTNGHDSASGALQEYEGMTSRTLQENEETEW